MVLKKGFGWILFAVLFIIDRITKISASSIQYRDLGIFQLNYTTNTGASFGLFQDFNLIIIIISIVAFAFIVYYRKEFNIYALTLLLAGLFGNLLDRIIFGYVIDFIDFKIWPVFNFADIYISLAIGITLYILLFPKKIIKKSKKSRGSQNSSKS